MAWTKQSFNDHNPYLSPECDAFVENYCKEKGITSQQLAMDADHFDIVLNLFMDSLNK